MNAEAVVAVAATTVAVNVPSEASAKNVATNPTTPALKTATKKPRTTVVATAPIGGNDAMHPKPMQRPTLKPRQPQKAPLPRHPAVNAASALTVDAAVAVVAVAATTVVGNVPNAASVKTVATNPTTPALKTATKKPLTTVAATARIGANDAMHR